MRQRGTGTVECVGERFRFRCPDGAGGRYTSPAEYDSREAALRGLAIYREARSRGELIPVAGITLRDYVEDTWLPRMERERPRSIKTYRAQWRARISKAPFAEWALKSIRRRDVRQWATMMDLGHPEHVVSVLRTILTAAIDDELLEVNPAARMRFRRTKRPDTSPTLEEVRALLSCSEIPWLVRAVVAVNVGTALRPGEWRHLRIENVQLEADPPRIVVTRGSDLAEATKNNKPRIAPLFGVALEALRLWLQDLPAYAPRNPRGLVFPQANGKLRRQSRPFGTFQKQSLWTLYLEKAGVRPCVRLHDLRHAAATSLLLGHQGRRWSTEEVQHLLGHSSVAVTEATYLHPGELLVSRAGRESALASPAEITNLAEIKSLREVSQLSPSPSPPASRKAENASGVTFAQGWTDAGLLLELRQAISRLHAGKYSQDEALSLGSRLITAKRNGDPVERAVARLDGAHWRSALVELVDVLVPDAVTARRRGRR